MRASNGGELFLDPIDLENSGTIESLDGSTVNIDELNLDGGGLVAARGGFVRIKESEVEGHTLRAEGTGTLLIEVTNVDNIGSLIEAHDNASVDILNTIEEEIVGGTFHTTDNGLIRGVGILNKITGNITVDGVLQSADGTVRVRNAVVQNETGNLQALDGATMVMREGVTVFEGMLSGDGLMDLFDDVVFDSTGSAMTWEDVTINLRGDATLTFHGDMTNNATLQINDLVDGVPSPNADVFINGDVTLDGDGRVLFASGGGNFIRPLDPGDATTPGDLLTIGADQSVTTTADSRGDIQTLMVNNGTIDAAGGTIDLNINALNMTMLPDLVNNGRIGASDEGRLVTPEITIDNAGGSAVGTIFATPGARVDMSRTTVIGGVFDSGGLISLDNTVVFDTIGDGDAPVGMTIQPGTTVQIGRGNNTRLGLNGTLTNDGILSINDTNSNQLADARLQINGDVTIDGSGQVVFSTKRSNEIVPLNEGDVLTIGADQTVITAANAQGLIQTLTVNNGTIDADNRSATDGDQAEITMLADSTNNGLIEASGGGRMSITGITIDNAGGASTGTISIDPESEIDIQSSTIIGGTINGGGRMDVNGAVIFDGVGLTIDNATTTINIGVGNSSVVELIGHITNNGVIRLNDLNSNLLVESALRINGDVLLDGNGQVRFNSNRQNEIVPLDPDNPVDVLTVGADQTILTTGSAMQGLITAHLTNDGTIDAFGGSIRVANESMNNANTMRATDGGTLNFDDVEVTNTGGTILSGAGSLVEYKESRIVGGTVAGEADSGMTLRTTTIEDAAFGGGSITVVGRSLLMNVTPVVEPSTITVGLSSTLTLQDTTLENATIVLNDTDSEFTLGNNAILEIDGDTLLTGAG